MKSKGHLGALLTRRPIPGKLMRRVLSEERDGCCSPRPGCGATPEPRAGTRCTRSIVGDANQEEEEEGLLIALAREKEERRRGGGGGGGGGRFIQS